MDDFVQHVFQEHNQEVDLLANMVAEGQKKTVIDRCSNSESWKAVKGFWDGSAKDNSKGQMADNQ